MNKTILTGRLTKDPEIKYTSSGTGITGFVLAVERMQKDANGQRQADFIPCKAFGGCADFISKYCHKGNMIGITGHIQTGSYTGSNGQTVYTEDVIVETVENYSPKDPQVSPQNQQAPSNQKPQNNQYRNPQYSQPMQNPNSGSDDDVPF